MSPEAAKSPKLPGTRPEGTRNEQEAARRVREMFSGIAPRYDLLNHLLSLSFDRHWRRRAAAYVLPALARPAARALDLCCGTGDLAFALERAGKPAAQIVGCDFTRPMLALGRAKAMRRSSHVRFVEADALQLPFADGSFDLIAAAFGFRNLASYGGGLAEIYRVLRPGGWVALVEFSPPRPGSLATLFRFYFERILPTIGGLVSGSRATYAYLPASVGRFAGPEELGTMLSEAGFVRVRWECWTGGIVCLHLGEKP